LAGLTEQFSELKNWTELRAYTRRRAESLGIAILEELQQYIAQHIRE